MEYDICIIGAGPAGYVGALKAAQSGKSVALIERKRLGGTCLNSGCIPTKAMRHCADVLNQTRNAQHFGTMIDGNVTLDFSRVIEHREKVVKNLVAGVRSLLKGRKVKMIGGDARLIAPGEIEVTKKGEAKRVTSEHIVLATGSKPVDLPGLVIDNDKILSSEGALRLDKPPGDLVIVGGGVIGCEIADIMTAFGSLVTVVEAAERILITEDRATARTMQKIMEARGIGFHVANTIKSVQEIDERLHIVLSGGDELEADKIIVCVGRMPNSDGLGLDDLGVSVDRGVIKVDSGGRTSVDGLWAAGDVIGGPMLAHAASHEVEVVVDNILGLKRNFDYDSIPAVVYTDPPVASVGLLEDAAKARGRAILVGRFSYMANGKALCLGESEGSAKVIVDKENEEILGGTIIGSHAEDMIHEIAIAVKHRMKVKDFIEVVHAHPTLAEIIPETVADSLGQAIHKIGRRMK